MKKERRRENNKERSLRECFEMKHHTTKNSNINKKREVKPQSYEESPEDSSNICDDDELDDVNLSFIPISPKTTTNSNEMRRIQKRKRLCYSAFYVPVRIMQNAQGQALLPIMFMNFCVH